MKKLVTIVVVLVIVGMLASPIISQASTQKQIPQDVAAMLIGIWQLVEESAITLEFTPDGIVRLPASEPVYVFPYTLQDNIITIVLPFTPENITLEILNLTESELSFRDDREIVINFNKIETDVGSDFSGVPDEVKMAIEEDIEGLIAGYNALSPNSSPTIPIPSWSYLSVQRAPSAQNAALSIVWLRGAEEVWCVVITPPIAGIKNYLVWRVGLLWSTSHFIGEDEFLKVGCTNFGANDTSSSSPDSQYELRYTYDEGAAEIVEVAISNVQSYSDGKVSASLEIHNPTSIAYGVAFTVNEGDVSGGTVEYLLTNSDELPVLMPQVSQSLGRVTFNPDTELQITLSKFGFSPSDEAYLETLDALTFLSVLGGVGYVPKEPSIEWYWESIVETFISTLPFGQRVDAIVDGALLTMQAARGDKEAQAETIIDFLTDNPEIVVEYMKTQGFSITADEVTRQLVAVQFADRIVGVLPVLSDYISKPDDSEVIIFTQSAN